MKNHVGTLLLALVFFGSGAFAQMSSIGDWIHNPNIDLITDEDRSVLIAEATTYPSYANYAALIIRCDAQARHGIEIYLNADKYLGSDDAYNVIYRVDGGTPLRGRWGTSTDHEAAFAPELGVSGVINNLLDGQELIFRITAYSSDYTYVLPIAGLRPALQKLGCYTGVL